MLFYAKLYFKIDFHTAVKSTVNKNKNIAKKDIFTKIK